MPNGAGWMTALPLSMRSLSARALATLRFRLFRCDQTQMLARRRDRYAVTMQPDRDAAVVMNHRYSPCMAMVSPSDSLVGAIVEPSRRGSKHLARRQINLRERSRSVARSAGFEPATYGFEVRCSIRLSYERHADEKAEKRNSSKASAHAMQDNPQHRIVLRSRRAIPDRLRLSKGLHRLLDGEKHGCLERAERAARADRKHDRGHRHVVRGFPQVQPSCSPKAYQKPCSFPPTDSM